MTVHSIPLPLPRVIFGIFLITALCACTEPPSWQKLLAAKISQQYPNYKILPSEGGNLSVERPGMSTMPVDVNAIAAFCLRGTKDCDYATDQMLLQLQKP